MAGDLMKLYWSLKSIPELADLPKKDRYEIWKACYSMVWRSWKSIILHIILIILFISVLTVIYNTFDKFIIGLLVAVSIGAICGFIEQQVAIYIIRPHIREYLSSHGKTN